MIILTAEQAALVRGQGAPGSRLEPLPLADGVTWVLPAAVLADPAYGAQRATLAALPTRTVDPGEFGGAD